jgi:hypothetical protein
MEDITQASEQTTDNLQTSVESSGSLLSSFSGQTEQTSEQQSDTDYSFIPEKFLEDGKPNIEKLSKSYSELEKKLGGKVPVSSPDEFDFQFQNPEQWDTKGLEDFKNFAVEKGFSKEQFNDALSLYEQNVSQMLDAFTPTPEKAVSVLKQEWGKSFDRNMQLAGKAIDTFAPSGFDISSIGNDPNVIKLLSAIGSQLTEDSIPNSHSVNAGSKMSKLEIEEILKSPDYRTSKEKQKIVQEFYATNYK